MPSSTSNTGIPSRIAYTIFLSARTSPSTSLSVTALPPLVFAVPLAIAALTRSSNAASASANAWCVSGQARICSRSLSIIAVSPGLPGAAADLCTAPEQQRQARAAERRRRSRVDKLAHAVLDSAAAVGRSLVRVSHFPFVPALVFAIAAAGQEPVAAPAAPVPFGIELPDGPAGQAWSKAKVDTQ